MRMIFLSVTPKPDIVWETTGISTTKKQSYYTLIRTIAKIKMQVTHIEKNYSICNKILIIFCKNIVPS